MKQNIARLVILGILIGLCLGQTIRLWLGDVSGHNFFGTYVVSDEINYTEPKQIWCNVSSKIYKIISSSEKKVLLEELVSGLRQAHLYLEKSPKEEYTKLLYETQGIIYEYGTELSIGEIIGQAISVQDRKYVDQAIEEIYIDLSLAESSKAYIYLIDKEDKIRGKISINSKLINGTEVVHLYKENGQGYKEYQASMTTNNTEGFFKSNVFYPRVDAKTTVAGTLFRLMPVIENIEEEALDNYVNELFKNPSYKNKNILLDGSAAFSDNLNISVIYRRIGTLEFEKTLLNNTEKLTEIGRLNKVNNFVKETGAIPEKLKKGLYLEESLYSEETGEYCYRFGYRYENGEVVLLSNRAKSQLGIEAFVELNIKNSEIISGKWLMLVPEHLEEEQEVTMSSLEAYEAIYEHTKISEANAFVLESLECAYMIEDINKAADFDWIGIYNSQPIRAIEKNDSGQ